MKFNSVFAIITVLSVLVHSQIISNNKIDTLDRQLILSDKAAEIYRDQIIDLSYELRNQKNESDMKETSSYIAGILDSMRNPEHYSAVWHDGYNQGQDTLEQYKTAEKNSKYPLQFIQGKPVIPEKDTDENSTKQ